MLLDLRHHTPNAIAITPAKPHCVTFDHRLSQYKSPPLQSSLYHLGLSFETHLIEPWHTGFARLLKMLSQRPCGASETLRHADTFVSYFFLGHHYLVTE